MSQDNLNISTLESKTENTIGTIELLFEVSKENIFLLLQANITE